MRKRSRKHPSSRKRLKRALKLPRFYRARFHQNIFQKYSIKREWGWPVSLAHLRFKFEPESQIDASGFLINQFFPTYYSSLISQSFPRIALSLMMMTLREERTLQKLTATAGKNEIVQKVNRATVSSVERQQFNVRKFDNSWRKNRFTHGGNFFQETLQRAFFRLNPVIKNAQVNQTFPTSYRSEESFSNSQQFFSTSLSHLSSVSFDLYSNAWLPAGRQFQSFGGASHENSLQINVTFNLTNKRQKKKTTQEKVHRAQAVYAPRVTRINRSGRSSSQRFNIALRQLVFNQSQALLPAAMFSPHFSGTSVNRSGNVSQTTFFINLAMYAFLDGRVEGSQLSLAKISQTYSTAHSLLTFASAETVYFSYPATLRTKLTQMREKSSSHILDFFSRLGFQHSSSRTFLQPILFLQQGDSVSVDFTRPFHFQPEMRLAKPPKMMIPEQQISEQPPAFTALDAPQSSQNGLPLPQTALATPEEINIQDLTDRVYDEFERKLHMEKIRRGL